MRRLTPGCLALLVASLAGPASAQSGASQSGAAQSGPTIVVPAAPAMVAAPSVITPAMPPLAMPPPGLVQQPTPNAGSADLTTPLAPPDNADTGDTGTGAAPAAAAPPPPAWLPGTSAQLGVLNVIEGSVTEVTVPVGGQTTIGGLQVSILACLRRPPEAMPDAAAFIATVATDQTGQPGAAPATDPQTDNAAPAGSAPTFRGWMLRSAPGAAVVGDAGETLRIIDCS